MRLENYLDFSNRRGLSGLFFARGSFGIVDGDVPYTRTTEGNTTTFCYESETIALTASFTQMPNGAVLRCDRLENRTDAPLAIHALRSRFCLDGSDYEVYTQYNSWHHESKGGWQPLVTQIRAQSEGIRSCDGAAPILAMHNRYNQKNTVFHLFPNAQWQMTAKKFPQQQKELVVVETGFCDEALSLTAAAKEIIELPTVLFFQAKNKVDLDAYKLHEVYNTLYPRKRLPVLYNSWLYCFDRLDIDALIAQADCAADLGFEAFMIDAGWFGNGGDWWNCVGDWEENTTSGPKGRLIELSRHVREKGMVFGLWFEPERATAQSQAVKNHPEYYINGTLLDFANPDAVDFITEAVASQIEKYDIGWLKFDFNDTIPCDPSGNAFYRYLQGQKRFVSALKARFPHLYLTNCASGGYRMELEQAKLFDSYWFTDNQGPYEGIRIIKDTLKRLPTALMERWSVQKYAKSFPRYGHTEEIGVMFSCNNATWDFILNVDDSYTNQFVSAGPIGFSCDLAAFPPQYKALWKENIQRHKADRDFYQNATARILIDGEDLIAIQYADPDQKRCVIQLFVKSTYAESILIYPILNEAATYRYQGEICQGRTLCEDGIRIENLKDNHAYCVELFQEEEKR